MELFSSDQQEHQPLAYRMRPRTLDEFAGQQHIVGEGRLLRRSIQADQLSSVIFYGPPGTGKTTLARVIANTTKSHFSTLNAVLSGVKQLREEIERARERLDMYGRRTILFVDEVHRWNKSQQDALLPWVENGTVILIGATTENPFFEVNRALVSRSRIFQLLPLERSDLEHVARQALRDPERGYGSYQVTFEPGALEHLIDIASGDARSLLNALELAVETSGTSFPPEKGSDIHITMEAAEESIQRKVVLYDKEGDYHFDVISAFIKSIRGSDPDAALYWLARMITAGEDPHFIFRRMLISASEDIGLADPQALVVTEAAAAAFDRIGLPEGRFHLTQAALYLATCPKSNSTLAFFDALKAVEEDHREVPPHLKDPSRDAEGFGHGEGYRYPHAYRDHWVAQQYLPAGLKGRVFYSPSNQGYEQTIRHEVERKREIQLESISDNSVPEILTFSPPDSQQDRWLARLADQRSAMLSELRSQLFAQLSLTRHDRILDISSPPGLLLWEACRAVPEGGVYAPVPDEQTRTLLEGYSKHLSSQQAPVLFPGDFREFSRKRSPQLLFEAVIGRNAFLRCPFKEQLFPMAAEVLSEDGVLLLSETVPSMGSRLSDHCSEVPMGRFSSCSVLTSPDALRTFLSKAEERIFKDTSSPLSGWTKDSLTSLAGEAGFSDVKHNEHTFHETREIREGDIRRWAEGSYAPEDRKIQNDLITLFASLVLRWRVLEVQLRCMKKDT